MHAMLIALAGLLTATARPAPADTTLHVTGLRTEYSPTRSEVTRGGPG